MADRLAKKRREPRVPFIGPSHPWTTLPAVAITSYINELHGFGVHYYDERLVCVDDPADPRLAAAWSSHSGGKIAASVLLTLHGPTAEEIAAGSTTSVLITTDGTASDPQRLGDWDWESETLEVAPPFMDDSKATCVDVSHLYWRGFPVLQLAAEPNPGSPAPRTLKELGLLYTPQQTLSTLVAWPTDDPEAMPTAGGLWEGFFLLPSEREGRVRTGLRLVQQLRISLTDEGLLVFAG
jgi:hypothetical protein